MCGWRDNALKEIILETQLRWFYHAHMLTAKAEHAFSMIKWKDMKVNKQTNNNKTKICKLSEKKKNMD